MGVESLERLKTFEKSEVKRFDKEKKALEKSYASQISALQMQIADVEVSQKEKLESALVNAREKATKEAEKSLKSADRKQHMQQKRASSKKAQAAEIVRKELTSDV